jgi:hypothetical protein
MTGPAQYYEIMDRLQRLSREFDEKIDKIDEAFQKGMKYLDELAEWFGDLVTSLKNALIRLKNWALAEARKLKAEFDKFMKGFNVPLVMMSLDDKWLEIRNLSNAVAATVERPQDRLDRFWEGSAATKYFSVVTPQVDAARRMAAMAEKASSTLQDMALAGIAFYGALVAAFITAIGGIVVAIVALAGGVTAPAGAAGILTAAGAAAALAAAAYTFLFLQDKWGSQLEADATNSAGFSAGPSWPRAAALSTDVTAADGDAPDWKPVPQTQP